MRPFNNTGLFPFEPSKILTDRQKSIGMDEKIKKEQVAAINASVKHVLVKSGKKVCKKSIIVKGQVIILPSTFYLRF